MPRFRCLSQLIRRSKCQPFLRRQSRHSNATTKANTKFNANLPSNFPTDESIEDNSQHLVYNYRPEKQNLSQHQSPQDDDKPKSFFRPFDHVDVGLKNSPAILPDPKYLVDVSSRRKTIGATAAGTSTASENVSLVDRPSTSIINQLPSPGPSQPLLHQQHIQKYHSLVASTPASASTTPISVSPIPFKQQPSHHHTTRSNIPVVPSAPAPKRKYVNVSVADFTAPPMQCTSTSTVRRNSFFENENDTPLKLSLDIGTRVRETLVPPPLPPTVSQTSADNASFQVHQQSNHSNEFLRVSVPLFRSTDAPLRVHPFDSLRRSLHPQPFSLSIFTPVWMEHTISSSFHITTDSDDRQPVTTVL